MYLRPTFFGIFVLLGVSWLHGQNFKVLHYTKTSGFDHQTRQNSLAMLQNLGSQNGFTADDDQTGAAFNSLANLQQYSVVVFCNTSGDQILGPAQRANFEMYIQNGGSLVGIHAASDTYRHSTANGSNTGTWDFYAETLGGSVQQSPNHTAANHIGTMDHLGSHPTTAHTPDPWNKTEEYYYWENGYLNPSNTSVLQVRSTGSNSYDNARPMSWYQNLTGGGRSFYTALGHANSDFTSDTAFQNHIRDAILWAAGQSMATTKDFPGSNFLLYPNPAKEKLTLSGISQKGFIGYKIISVQGKVMTQELLDFSCTEAEIDISHLKSGLYFISLKNGKNAFPAVYPFTVL